MHRVTTRTTCPMCRAVFRTAFRRCPIDGAALAPLPQDPLVGERLRDRYTIERVFADSVLGRIYLATDERSGEGCAVKVMYGDYASIVRHRRRFDREIEIGSRLCHPNVLSVLDAGETRGGLPFLVTVHVDGESLADILERDAPLRAPRTRRLIADLAAGLAHVHEHGLLLRNLGRDSVVVDQHGEEETAIIADLGAAVATAVDAPRQMGRLTRRGKIVGPPVYLAPEVSGGRIGDARADLYSLGVLLYEMLAGKPPFQGSAIALAAQHAAVRAPRVSERVPGATVPPELERIALALLAKDPADRYASAAELLAELERFTLDRQ